MLTVISSMAPRALLAELLAAWQAEGGTPVSSQAVGGVDAARRVAAGEVFDVVVLATDAIERLAAAGHVRAASERAVVRSSVAVAVRAGTAQSDISSADALQSEISSADALRRAVLAAPSIGVSTGPSGGALMALFERWGIAPQLAGRLVQAPPGVPVATLVARGDVALGFQQRSELLGVDGIRVLGDLPGEIAIVTTFSAAVATTATAPDEATRLVDFLSSPNHDEARDRHGFTSA
jgi:molybdate transport system substrate-binding protein